MKYLVFVLILNGCISNIVTQFPNVEDADGSFSIGYNSLGHGGTGDAIYAILRKATGWTSSSLNSAQNNVDATLSYPSSSDNKNVKFTHLHTKAKKQVIKALDELIKSLAQISHQETENVDTRRIIPSPQYLISNFIIILTNLFRYVISSLF